jgi:hypothetical protein
MSHAGKGDSCTAMDGTVVYQTTADLDEMELSTAVLMSLESLPGYDVENGETVVFDSVDLDALDELFTMPTADTPRGCVTFPVDEYQLTVTAAGEITIRT